MIIARLLFLLLSVPLAGQAQFRYAIANGEVTITGIAAHDAGYLTIPRTIEGMPVTGIGDGAFVKSHVTGWFSIGGEIPDTVKFIGSQAFYGNGMGNLTVPDSVISIGYEAFMNSAGGNITIGDGCTSIGGRAFAECPGLTSFTIGSSLTYFGFHGWDVWENSRNLTSITVKVSNPVLKSVEGVLFNKSRESLVCYPPARPGSHYTIPDGVTTIDSGGIAAFFICPNLTSVTIPASVAHVEAGDFGTFYGCGKLTNVIFLGNAPAFEGGWGWFSGSPVTVYYLAGTTGWGPTAGGAPTKQLPAISIITEPASVEVPEGGTTNFLLKLAAKPVADTQVTVARTSGDADIGISGGASLTFTTSNWATYQSVTVSAAEDDGDNGNGSAAVTCNGIGLTNAVVAISEVDDDFTLDVVMALHGIVNRIPEASYYDNGTVVTLTAVPDPTYFFNGWTGNLDGTNNPTTITMDGNKSVSAGYMAISMPEVLPPRAIETNKFKARWKWVEGASPEGEVSVALDAGFTHFVPGYDSLYVCNAAKLMVTNLLPGQVYWYRVRRLLPDGSASPWSASMKVRTGKGMPVFKDLLSDGAVSKGISQQFAISNLVAGGGTLKVKSSDENAVKAGLSDGALTLQYLWIGTNNASVKLTLTHPKTGYTASYEAALSRAKGSVAVLGLTALTNAGAVMAQELTLENRTEGTVYGMRVQALGLDQPAWLINQTGLDPVSGAAIREIPCVLPSGSQMVVRLTYKLAYKKQSKTRPVAYGAWAVMTPVNGAPPVSGELTITRQNPFDGLWLLGMPANRNRFYVVYHSDDDGESWIPEESLVRATANYLMWLDMDEEAPSNRIYRVEDFAP